jgi:predicted nucleic acid-binding Zn ribbon protein
MADRELLEVPYYLLNESGRNTSSKSHCQVCDSIEALESGQMTGAGECIEPAQRNERLRAWKLQAGG